MVPMLHRTSRIGLVLAALSAGLTGAAAVAEEADFPAGVKMRELVGERLEYRIKWSGVQIGRAHV